MEIIQSYQSKTGKIFINEQECIDHENKFDALINKYAKIVARFHLTLSNDIGHCGPKDKDDSSESIRFNEFNSKLINFLALHEMGLKWD